MSKTAKCIVIVQRGNKIKARCYEADTIETTVKTSEVKSVKENEINYNDDLYLACKIALARLFGNKEDEENLVKGNQPVKFKPGDQVRILENEEIYLTKGKLAIVESYEDYDGDIVVKEINNPFMDSGWCIHKSKVELVKDEDIKPKFNVGDIVKVVNNGKCYRLYDIWFEKNNCKELLKYYKIGSCCQNGEKYLVVAVGKDDYVCAIKDLKGQVYLIDETGLKGANE